MPSPPLARLLVERQGHPHGSFRLTKAKSVLGRDPKLALCLNDTRVSRRHALLLHQEDGTYVRDLESKNGLFVNGARLPPRCSLRLRPGDLVLVGQSTLRYEELSRSPPASTALPVCAGPSKRRQPVSSSEAFLVPALTAMLLGMGSGLFLALLG